MREPEAGRQSSLSRSEKKELIRKMAAGPGGLPAGAGPEAGGVEQFPEYQRIQTEKRIAERNGIRNPFFVPHEGVPSATIRVDGRELVNFASYNYLGLNGHPEVAGAAIAAIRDSGTSASASRLVSGECPQHRELERGIARFLGVEDCLVFVSGHTTNLSTIGALAGPKDLILHDRLSHQSIVQGAAASGAHRLVFPHNDAAFVDRILRERRNQYERVLLIVEGIYSMDGDFPPLPELIEIKDRHGALLMVDEAHSIGTAGETGRGVTEHFGIPASRVEILMGTLSKTLAGCGGYIAGSAALVELLKYTASGFVYSVGMPPPVAAASNAALAVLRREPERVTRLLANGRYFLNQAREQGLNTGLSAGANIVPILIGNSVMAVRLANELFQEGINVKPVCYPAVEEGGARLRFFLSSEHSTAQIDQALALVSELLERINGDLR